jgi:hypothetical protein
MRTLIVYLLMPLLAACAWLTCRANGMKPACGLSNETAVSCSWASSKFSLSLDSGLSVETAKKMPLPTLSITPVEGAEQLVGIFKIGIFGSSPWCAKISGLGGSMRVRTMAPYMSSKDAAIAIVAEPTTEFELPSPGPTITICDQAHQNDGENELFIVVGDPVAVAGLIRDPSRVGIKNLLRANVISKESPEVRSGYLFVKMNSANSAQLLDFAVRGGFRYLLVNWGSWARTYGTYAPNLLNFPGGWGDIRGVALAAHRRGIGLGLHVMSNMIEPSDPIVADRSSNMQLASYAEAIIAKELLPDSKIVQLKDYRVTANDGESPSTLSHAVNVRFDGEIAKCQVKQIQAQPVLFECIRGAYGTSISAHRQGATVSLLMMKDGAFNIDSAKPLLSMVATHIADSVNRVGAGMIYFDGAEIVASGRGQFERLNKIASLPMAVVARLNHPVFVQASTFSTRLWPYVSRMASGDAASLAASEYLSAVKLHSIATYSDNLMPGELGWLGVVAETGAYSDTSPEVISTYMARALALDLPFSIETTYRDLLANSYTPRIFNILNITNHILNNGPIDAAVRDKLRYGNWYVLASEHENSALFGELISQSSKHVRGTRKVSTTSFIAPAGSTGILLRIGNVVGLKGDGARIWSEGSTQGASSSAVAHQSRDFRNNPNGFWASHNIADGDWSRSRYLEIVYDFTPAGDCKPTLDIQAHDRLGRIRDYFLRVSKGRGLEAVLYFGVPSEDYIVGGSIDDIANPNKRLLGFDFGHVVSLNTQWVSSCGNEDLATFQPIALSTMTETDSMVRDISVSVGGVEAFGISKLSSGDVLDLFPDGTATKCRRGSCETLVLR